MNMLGSLSPTSVPIDPLQPGDAVKAQVAMAAQVKVLHAQASLGAQLISLLDPQLGRNLDARA
jgi:hypothetical protein